MRGAKMKAKLIRGSALLLCAAFFTVVLSLSFAPTAGDPGRTFTIKADRITMRCTNIESGLCGLIGLLAGYIKAENVTMENVRVIYRNRVMYLPYGYTDNMEMWVTIFSVLWTALTHLLESIPMMLGMQVTLDDVEMDVYWSQMRSLNFENLKVVMN